MSGKREILVALLSSVVISCSSPSEPTAPPPDLRGVFAGPAVSWRWSDAINEMSGRTSGCAGRIEITSQSGASFEGRYSIDCSGEGTSAGVVESGMVGSSGTVSFRLREQQGWAPGLLPGWYNPPCATTVDSRSYEGTFRDGSLDVRRVLTLECLAGRVVVTARFLGSRQ
jgi:hypothetical protein